MACSHGSSGCAIEADLPLCLVHVTECLTRGHDEVVKPQSHDLCRRLVLSVEPEPAHQRLVAQRDELFVGRDLLVVVMGDKGALHKLDPAADDAAGGDLVEIAVAIGAVVGDGSCLAQWHALRAVSDTERRCPCCRGRCTRGGPNGP